MKTNITELRLLSTVEIADQITGCPPGSNEPAVPGCNRSTDGYQPDPDQPQVDCPVRNTSAGARISLRKGR